MITQDCSPLMFDESWQVKLARFAAITFCKRRPHARKWGNAHFIYPAWDRVRRISKKLPSDGEQAKRLAFTAAYKGCVDELRVISGTRQKYRIKLCPLSDFISEKRPRPSTYERCLEIWNDYRGDRKDLEWVQRIWMYLWLVEGTPMKQIGDLWGLTAEAISQSIGRARKKLPHTGITKAQRRHDPQEFAKWYMRGENIATITRRFNTTKEHCRKLLKKAGIIPQKQTKRIESNNGISEE